MKTIQSYTIKQASELSGLPESTLRYYETVGLINRINRDYIVSIAHIMKTILILL